MATMCEGCMFYVIRFVRLFLILYVLDVPELPCQRRTASAQTTYTTTADCCNLARHDSSAFFTFDERLQKQLPIRCNELRHQYLVQADHQSSGFCNRAAIFGGTNFKQNASDASAYAWISCAGHITSASPRKSSERSDWISCLYCVIVCCQRNLVEKYLSIE